MLPLYHYVTIIPLCYHYTIMLPLYHYVTIMLPLYHYVTIMLLFTIAFMFCSCCFICI